MALFLFIKTIDAFIDLHDDYTLETILLANSSLYVKKTFAPYNQGSDFIQIATNIKKIGDAPTVIDNNDNATNSMSYEDTHELILIESSILNIDSMFKLTTNHELYYKQLLGRSTDGRYQYGEYKLLDINVNEFNSFFPGMCLCKERW